MSFVKRGLVSDGGGMYFLPRRVGLPRAKELIFTGRSVDAKEALAIGLADRVSAPETLVADARRLGARTGAGLQRLPSRCRNRSSTAPSSRPEEQVFALGREAQAVCYTTAEHRESVAAFLNKTGR